MTLEDSTNALSKFSFDCAFYRRTKRDLLANGWSEVQIFGRCEIDVDTLLLGFMDMQDAHPVSTWCARACNRILPTASLPVRLAATWLLTKLMRVSTEMNHFCKGPCLIQSPVSHLAECRKHEREPGLDDADSGEAGKFAVRHADRPCSMVCCAHTLSLIHNTWLALSPTMKSTVLFLPPLVSVHANVVVQASGTTVAISTPPGILS